MFPAYPWHPTEEDKITALKELAESRRKMNEINTWKPGFFIDSPRYPKDKKWKEEQKKEEKLLVRPYPKGNPVCKATDPEMAKWIAKRLNLASDLQEHADNIVELFKSFPDVNDSRSSKEDIFDHISEWFWDEAQPTINNLKETLEEHKNGE